MDDKTFYASLDQTFSREQMLAIVSHDIKNPISVIQLEAQMLLKLADEGVDNPLSNKVRHQANRILRTTERMKELISDLLEKHKGEHNLSNLEKSHCTLGGLFQDVLDSLKALFVQKHLHIFFRQDEYLAGMFDKAKLTQVITNLLSNAVKFAPDGGQIHIQVLQQAEEILCRICDNGPGLKSEDMNHVFEKFWTGGVRGRSDTGLGLFICKSIVEAHGGQIFVENLPEGGACFSFTLPLLGADQTEIIIKDKHRKILIIDDDEDLRDAMAWVLNKEGYSVHSYGDPYKAFESLAIGRHRPQLMIVDFQMDGMNGFEFLKKKNECSELDVRECPVILISASPDEVEAQERSEDLKQLMTKPLDLESLLENIKNLTN